MRYVYRPKHPQADEFGMIEAEVFYGGPLECSMKSAPMVISDHMEPLKHHGTGRILDSKSEFRKDTKAVGAVELGNDPIKPRQPIKLDNRQRVEDIKWAIYQLKNG